MFIVYCLMFNEVVIPLSFMLFTLNLKHSALNKNMVVNVYYLLFNGALNSNTAKQDGKPSCFAVLLFVIR